MASPPGSPRTTGAMEEERPSPMAALSGPSSSSSSNNGTISRAKKGQKETVGKGRWTKREHYAFIEGLKKFGREWKAISEVVRTRTPVQTRTHHQKYDQQMKKGRRFPEEPYDDEDESDRDGGGGGKGARTGTSRSPRGAILLSPAAPVVRGKRLTLRPGGGGGGGGGGRDGPRSTRASVAATMTRAKVNAVKAAEKEAAAAAKAAEEEAAAAAKAAEEEVAAAATASSGRSTMGTDGGDAGNAGGGKRGRECDDERRPEKRLRAEQPPASADLAAYFTATVGAAPAYRQDFHRASFSPSLSASRAVTPPPPEVSPSFQNDAGARNSMWSPIGSVKVRGSAPEAAGVDGGAGAGGVRVPVPFSEASTRGIGSNNVWANRHSPLMSDTFLAECFAVAATEAVQASPSAAPSFSYFPASGNGRGAVNPRHDSMGETPQGGGVAGGECFPLGGTESALLYSSSSASGAAATAAAAAAAAAVHSGHQFLQQQQRLQLWQQFHQQQKLQQLQLQLQQRFLLSSRSATGTPFGGACDATTGVSSVTHFDPNRAGISIPDIGALEPCSTSGYAAGSRSTGGSSGGGIGRGGRLLPFGGLSSAYYGAGALGDTLGFAGVAGDLGGAGVGVVGASEVVAGNTNHGQHERTYSCDESAAIVREQQHQQKRKDQLLLFGQHYYCEDNDKGASAVAPRASKLLLAPPSTIDGDTGTRNGKPSVPSAIPSYAGMGKSGGDDSSGGRDVFSESGSGCEDLLPGDPETDDWMSLQTLDLLECTFGEWQDGGINDKPQFDTVARVLIDDPFGTL